MTPGVPYKPPRLGSPIFLSIPAVDVQRAYKFYSTVFNWNFYGDKQPAEYSKDDVMLFDFNPDVNLSGGIEKILPGTSIRTGKGGTAFYFIVEDVEKVVAVIENAGGKVISEVQKEGTNGLYRFFEDTEGNVNVVYQYVGPLAV